MTTTQIHVNLNNVNIGGWVEQTLSSHIHLRFVLVSGNKIRINVI